MSYTRRIVLLSTVCVLAGCSGIKTDIRTEAPPGYRADAASRVASVDWTMAEIVTVDMDEYDFAPSSLNLEAGKPCRLHLENTGGKSHTFSSAPFFKTIAVRRLTTREGTVEAPFIQVQRSILTSLLSDCWAAMKDEPETLHARLNRTIQPVRRASGAEY